MTLEGVLASLGSFGSPSVRMEVSDSWVASRVILGALGSPRRREVSWTVGLRVEILRSRTLSDDHPLAKEETIPTHVRRHTPASVP